ncbi:hypothetical protein L596_014589 [Steinernema carpocapsae]|uniref:Cadherin domain-containing protein n=1 Tax=Steinernema carpocapsae TaxID=34508 RepID=A0A4U5NCC7_STECR|nr:hypothetical protein L596_014589 [Steinernema carpocapsae]
MKGSKRNPFLGFGPFWPVVLLFLDISGGCLLENDRNSVYVSVFEDLKIGSTLAELPVIGRSFGPDANIQLKLTPGQEDLVELNAAEKKLILKRELDREKRSRLEQTRNRGPMPRSRRQNLPLVNISTFVTVKDVNDNAPRFDQSEYRIRMPEELPNDTIIFVDFEATDDDQPGPNSYVNYRITRGAEYLTIPDPSRPIVVVGGRVDYEKIQRFEVEIEASDSGTPQLRSTVALHVTVLDVDDQNPVFGSQSYYANSVMENAFEILPESITAKDGDTLNATIGYSLSGAHHESFAIDAKGVVRPLNDSVIPTTLLIRAFEIDRPERYSTAMLRIAEQSSIEFEHSLYSIQISSSIPVDSEILRVRASGSSSNGKLRYSILNDEGDVLKIEERSGRISLKSPLKLEKYAFKISATDGKTRGWTRLELSVDQANSHIPEFDQTEYFFNMKSSNLIGQVRATDQDKDDIITYRLLNFQTIFDIDDDGMLSRRSSVPNLDITRQNEVYELVVLAEDTVGQRQFVTVVVTAMNQAALTTSFLLAVGIFALLVILFIIIVYMITRRCISCMTEARRNKVCWVSKTGDNGVVISGSVPTEIESRTCSSANSSHSKRFSPPSTVPIEDKDREVADVYASTSVASPARIRGAHLVPVTVATSRSGPPTIYF